MRKIDLIVAFFKKNSYLLLCLLFIIAGVLIRLYLIFTRDIFVDEVFYTEIALTKTVYQILTIDHWIKDHAILYYLYLKPFLILTTDIVLLRLSNLILYLAASFSIFFLLKKEKLFSLMLIFLFSFFNYFFFMQAMISPFNLAMTFFIISFTLIFRFLSEDINKKNIVIFLTLFPLATSLGFYSDYSFSYAYFFYIIFLILIFLKNKQLFLIFLNALSLNVIFVIPGIFQLINNLTKINSLFGWVTYKEPNFLKFIVFFFDYLLFQNAGLFLLLSVFLILLLSFTVKTKRLKTLLQAVLLSFLASTLFLFYFINNYFSIFIDRSFWFFYFMFIAIFSLIFLFLNKKAFLYFLYYSLIVVLLLRRNLFFRLDVYGRVPYFDISYKKIVKELINEPQLKNQAEIIIINKNYLCHPLTNYYFNPIFRKHNLSAEIDDFIKNKDFVVYRQEKILDKEKIADFIIEKIKQSGNQMFVVVGCFGSEPIINQIKNETGGFHKLFIYKLINRQDKGIFIRIK